MPEVSTTYAERAADTTSISIEELYERGLHACHLGDRSTLRAVLADLLEAFEGPSRAGSRQAVHAFCLQQSAIGDLATVSDLLDGLRATWGTDAALRGAA